MEQNIRQRKISNKRKVANNRRFVNFAVVLVLISMLYFTFTLARNKIEYNRTNNQLNELITQKESIKKEINSLEKKYENRESIEFAEEVAREKLGMVKAKEYIIKEKK
ncbi:FtsB family cell division protein [Miniphocaeibacter massiliensis]|uniref:FtsB family cell division protein n=1 Tax=Miniphocaeibacter massiliensis TaxID=2041841 RepID=UPI000C07C0C6|nr:septum formation initiator family protein [Miniphocaeibacter massiliensis]